MGNVHVENIDIYFNEKMKNPEFRRLYKIERVKVALAQKIAEMRDDLHLNQKDLAARLGVSQQFISQLETGRSGNGNLTLATLVRLAGALGRKVRITFPKDAYRRKASRLAKDGIKSASRK
ncbi:MAG TPA: helix-turn-helix transcriptional regulator [Candidatus Omnitrophota bacterium]|nr:helix-turn-helix transcriptional regulator [Candidatus Omnitrophota bacterium]